MKHKIGVLGAGTWGMALARMLTVSGNEVQVWSALPAEVDSLSTTRVHPNLPGMKIPAELQFTKSIEDVCTRVVERLSTSASMADHTCTSLPLTVSIRASAMPQVPAPRTPIFRFVTFVSSVCTGSRAAGEFARHRQTRCARCYAHCTRKRLPRQPACRIAQSSRSGWDVFVHNTRFLQTICTAGRFML